MKCGRCHVEIVRAMGYIQIIAHGTSVSPGRLEVSYCTWFCAAVAMDLCALKTLETTPMVTQMPQCRSWVAEHGEGDARN
jgi:hypothetical protein